MIKEKIIDGILYVSEDGGKTWKKDNGEEVDPKKSDQEGGEGEGEGESQESSADGGEGGEGEGNEEDTDKDIQEAAKSIAKELERYNTIQEKQFTKKLELQSKDIKVEDAQFKLYETKAGKEVTMPTEAARLCGEYLKSVIKHIKYNNPVEFVKAEKYREKLDKYAEKLEPVQVGVAAEGGNLVPTVLYNKIIPLLEDTAVMRSKATIIDMTGMKTNQLNITGVVGKPYATWNSEAAQKGTSSVEFNQISLTPYNLAVIVPVTLDIIDSSPFNVVKLVTGWMAEGIAKEEDRAFFTGNGTGRPTGIDNYTFPGRKTFSAGGALSWIHLNSAFWRLNAGYRAKAIWAMHTDTLETVSNFRDTTGQPILKEEGAVINDKLDVPTIKRKGVYEQNDFGNNKIFFFDPTAYWIGYNRGLTIDLAKEATIRDQNMFERNMVAIRVEERIDGELTTTQAGVEITNVRT